MIEPFLKCVPHGNGRVVWHLFTDRKKKKFNNLDEALDELLKFCIKNKVEVNFKSLKGLLH